MNKVEAKRNRMRAAVKVLQEYWETYDKQMCYEDYSDQTLIDDALYAIGLAIDREKYEYAGGYKKLKEEVLVPHLSPNEQAR